MTRKLLTEEGGRVVGGFGTMSEGRNHILWGKGLVLDVLGRKL